MTAYPRDVEDYLKQKVREGTAATRRDAIIAAVRLARDVESGGESLADDEAQARRWQQCGMSEPLDIEALKAELATRRDDS